MNNQNTNNQQVQRLLNSVMTDLAQMNLAFEYLRKSHETLERRLAAAEKESPKVRTSLADKARMRALETCFAYRNDSLGLQQWAKKTTQAIAKRNNKKNGSAITRQIVASLERESHGASLRQARKKGIAAMDVILRDDHLMLAYITRLEEEYLLAGCENNKGGTIHEKKKLSGKAGGAVS